MSIIPPRPPPPHHLLLPSSSKSIKQVIRINMQHRAHPSSQQLEALLVPCRQGEYLFSDRLCSCSILNAFSFPSAHQLCSYSTLHTSFSPSAINCARTQHYIHPLPLQPSIMLLSKITCLLFSFTDQMALAQHYAHPLPIQRSIVLLLNITCLLFSLTDQLCSCSTLQVSSSPLPVMSESTIK